MRHPRLVVTRDIAESETSADRGFVEGDTLYRYDDPTYGCITDTGMAVSMKRGETPFFEVPADAVRYAPKVETVVTSGEAGEDYIEMACHMPGRLVELFSDKQVLDITVDLDEKDGIHVFSVRFSPNPDGQLERTRD